MIDTAIIVDLLRGHQPALDWIESLEVEDRFISIVTVFELLEGCESLRAQRQLERELDGYVTLPITDAVSFQALAWLREHRLRAGVGYPDCLIGATARVFGLPLYTLNVRHFRALQGLRVECPY
ncbi:MAG: type II toxin-antitoxin system VapC family toxin [Anaerolineae bacterium]|nr:type II toxin-antitoxin system VapC family toxin [Candidatus Roseilinea sp.]MDW8448756.1 type II toxin-antitoxin system VapC family toxin [Anaerolineae bacterium]